jgi:hypothetical protein
MFFSLTAGTLLAAAAWLGQTRGSELTAKPAAQATPPAKSPARIDLPSLTDPAKATCGNNNTAVHFEASPSAAARKARKEEKLVFVLHVSGLFEDPKVT